MSKQPHREEDINSVPPRGRGQSATVMKSKKGRGGKTVTIVTGLHHCPQALDRLAKHLKKTCGCGGTVKQGEIIIQGDQCAKAAMELENLGYTVKRSGAKEPLRA